MERTRQRIFVDGPKNVMLIVCPGKYPGYKNETPQKIP